MNSRPAPTLVLLDPAAIETDPSAYQFRSNGDKRNGVTEAGRFHEARWDPVLHGDPLLVHERLDGRVFVADGHHRLELAKRTNAAGTGPGQVQALVLREADGYTVEDARVVAAYKNFAQGHCDPVDAARVFKEVASGRVHRDLLPELDLRKNSLSLSYSLSQLSYPALDMVQQGNIVPEIAGIVATGLKDPARQEETLRMLSASLRRPYAVIPESTGLGAMAGPSQYPSRHQARAALSDALWKASLIG